MTTGQQILTIAIMGVSVMATRFVPFLLFPSREHTPRFVLFLGRYLPSAVFGMLVVYCLKDVSFLSGWHGLPQLIGIVLTAALHLWKNNLLLSIAGGTVGYMLIVQTIFT